MRFQPLLRSAARALICIGVLALAGCEMPQQSGQQVTIGSNPAGTNVYAVSAGLAKALQDSRGVRTTIRPFSGSSVYIPLLQRGEITLGLNTGVDTYLSFHGLPPYTVPMSNLRLLMLGFPLHITYMVRADSGIYRAEDLRGRRVVVTLRANAGLEELHRGILATGGLSEDDVDAMTVAGLPDGIRMLTEGRADAIPIGLDTALVLQADSAIAGGVRFITLGDDEARLSQLMPAAKAVTMPAGASAGVREEIRIPQIADYINTGIHLDEEEAYAIVKTLHEQWPSLRKSYPQLEAIGPDQVAPADSPHPYHPGAVRYFKEAGLWTEAHERNQQRALADASPSTASTARWVVAASP